MKRMRIGLLGGSFDPVHRAHVAVALQAQQTLNLDQVQLIPAGHPWQRPPLSASANDRLAMLDLAIQCHPSLVVNPIETQRSGPTYTIDTLESLPGGHAYYWILGADQLHNFCTWHRWQDIAQIAQLAVVARPGNTLAPPAALEDLLITSGRKLNIIPFQPMSIAARDIRRKLACGESTDELLPPAVSEYISQHGLYRHQTNASTDQ